MILYLAYLTDWKRHHRGKCLGFEMKRREWR